MNQRFKKRHFGSASPATAIISGMFTGLNHQDYIHLLKQNGYYWQFYDWQQLLLEQLLIPGISDNFRYRYSALVDSISQLLHKPLCVKQFYFSLAITFSHLKLNIVNGAHISVKRSQSDETFF
jgi:hypothetical protein